VQGQTESKEINILIEGEHNPKEVALIVLQKVVEIN
jgi:hypothetical protein